MANFLENKKWIQVGNAWLNVKNVVCIDPRVNNKGNLQYIIVHLNRSLVLSENDDPDDEQYVKVDRLLVDEKDDMLNLMLQIYGSSSKKEILQWIGERNKT